MSEDELVELLCPFVDGELSRCQAEILEAHLGQCESCRLEVDKLAALVTEVASLPELKAPPELLANVRRALPARERASFPRRRQLTRWLAVAAGLLICVWVASIGSWSGQKLDDQAANQKSGGGGRAHEVSRPPEQPPTPSHQNVAGDLRDPEGGAGLMIEYEGNSTDWEGGEEDDSSIESIESIEKETGLEVGEVAERDIPAIRDLLHDTKTPAFFFEVDREDIVALVDLLNQEPSLRVVLDDGAGDFDFQQDPAGSAAGNREEHRGRIPGDDRLDGQELDEEQPRFGMTDNPRSPLQQTARRGDELEKLIQRLGFATPAPSSMAEDTLWAASGSETVAPEYFRIFRVPNGKLETARLLFVREAEVERFRALLEMSDLKETASEEATGAVE